jgi:hypothetical protein
MVFVSINTIFGACWLKLCLSGHKLLVLQLMDLKVFLSGLSHQLTAMTVFS